MTFMSPSMTNLRLVRNMMTCTSSMEPTELTQLTLSLYIYTVKPV
jgi:hypothetical protein